MTVAMEAGYKPLRQNSLANKSSLMSLIMTYNLFIEVKVHMDDFKEGLELFGVYQHKYQCLLRPLFIDESTRITASKFMNVHLCFETGHMQS